MKLGLNSECMQKANRNLVLSILLEKKNVSRTELAKLTHLKRATITNIINEFLVAGLVREEGFQIEVNGRKTESLGLHVPNVVILSARLTREFFDVYAFSFAGEMLHKTRRAVSTEDDIDVIMGGVYADIDAMIARVGQDHVLGMCVGVPGPYVRGRHNVAIVTGFEQLGRIDIHKELAERYPFLMVTEHDSKLSALAEWRSLSPTVRANENSLIAIQSIGIGIGSGMIINDRIFHGTAGIAGEIGHMGVNFNGPAQQGQKGMFETYASTGSVRKYMLERMYEFPDTSLTDASDYAQIREAYHKNDPLAVCAMDNLAWKLAYGLTSLIFVMNPSRIVLSEDYPSSQRFIDKVKSSLRQMVYPELLETTTIQYSTLQMDSTILGGYSLVLDRMLKSDLLLETLEKMRTANGKG